MKKIIAVDCDDVLFNLVPLWVQKYNFIWNDSLNYREITDWDISRFVKPECGNKIYSYLDEKMYLEKNLVKDSLWGVGQLRKLGYRVIFVTSNSFNMGGVKFEWLNKNGFDVDKKDYFECGDKGLIKFNLLLDDNSENVASAGRRGVIFTQPWNVKNKHLRRVSTWKEFIKNMKENKYGI